MLPSCPLSSSEDGHPFLPYPARTSLLWPQGPQARGEPGGGAWQRKWEAGRGHFETPGLGPGPPWKSHLPFWEPGPELGPLRSPRGVQRREGRAEAREKELDKTVGDRDLHTQRNRNKERDRRRSAEVWDNTEVARTWPLLGGARGPGPLSSVPWLLLSRRAGVGPPGHPRRETLPLLLHAPPLPTPPPPHPYNLPLKGLRGG